VITLSIFVFGATDCASSHSGELWRSRFDATRNVIVVNNGHRDFVFASRTQALKLRYLVRLYVKEDFACLAYVTPHGFDEIVKDDFAAPANAFADRQHGLKSGFKRFMKKHTEHAEDEDDDD
jgi:hypothetical protein